jgi:hypothetical protein
MNETKRRFVKNAAKLFDLGVLVSAFCLTIICFYSDADGWSLRQFLQLRIKLSNLIVFILFAAIWHLSFSLFCGGDCSRNCEPVPYRDAVLPRSVLGH